MTEYLILEMNSYNVYSFFKVWLHQLFHTWLHCLLYSRVRGRRLLLVYHCFTGNLRTDSVLDKCIHVSRVGSATSYRVHGRLRRVRDQILHQWPAVAWQPPELLHPWFPTGGVPPPNLQLHARHDAEAQHDHHGSQHPVEHLQWQQGRSYKKQADNTQHHQSED